MYQQWDSHMKSFCVISLIPSSLLHIFKSLFNTISIPHPCKRNCVEDWTNLFSGFSVIIFAWQVEDHARPLKGPLPPKLQPVHNCTMQPVSQLWRLIHQPDNSNAISVTLHLSGANQLTTHMKKGSASPRAQVVRCEQSVVELDPPPKQHHLLRQIFIFQHSLPTVNNCW